MQLASDLDNTEFVGAQNPDNILSVQFYDYASLDKFKTEQTGIKSYRAECPFVRIAVPGNDKSVIERPAEPRDVARFPNQWLNYQMTTGKIAMADDVPGWKLEKWEELNDEQVRNLKHLRFYTVEQIAGASDAQVQGIGMGGQGLKNRAIAALDSRNNAKANSEIAKRDETIEKLIEQVQALTALVKAPNTTKKMPVKKGVKKMPVADEQAAA